MRRTVPVLLALALACAGCESPPRQLLALQSSKMTVEAGGTVLLTATLTEDGTPLPEIEVVFDSDIGTFLDPTSVETNETGQATVRFQVPDSGATSAEVTATASAYDKLSRLTLAVESGGGDGGGTDR